MSNTSELPHEPPLPGSTSVPHRPQTASSLVFTEIPSHGGHSANHFELRHRPPLPLSPPPPPPLPPQLSLPTSGASTPRLASPSARTSFTRVDIDTLGDHEAVVHSIPMSQDPQEDDLCPPPRGRSSDPSHSPDLQPPEHSDDVGASAVPGVVVVVAESSGPTPNPPEQQQHQQDQVVVPVTPQTFITFLLPSGKRRTMSFEPETTIGRVKELIWNAWPSEWQDERPPAPSYLRMFYLGKMLQDDDTLTKLKLPSSHPQAPIPTIVHLSIRPYNLPGDDNTTKKKRKGSDALSVPDDTTTSSSCCGCVIC